MSAPISPVPLTPNTAGFIPADVLATYSNFYHVPHPLQGLDTTVVHFAPNGNVTHLAGPGAGQEGVFLSQLMQGEQQMPFEQVVTEGAYQWGATIERTNYPKRLINLRLAIAGYTQYAYSLCDNRWWAGQDETQDGWLGVFTRFTGWRWIPVRPFKTVDTAQQMDPVAYGNNLAVWDVNWVCERPWYSKPALFQTWSAATSTYSLAAGGYSGNVVLANRGDLPTYVAYLVNGAGTCTVQDNNSSTMVQLPEIFATDGPCLCDTDPQNRTLTASSDPIDNLFYQYIRSSTVLNLLLSNIGEEGEPWWQRGYTRFLNAVPPQTVTQFNIVHSNPKATVTVILVQRYKRSR